ncbi:MAG: Cof-type HAD-IIB family hydrolase [Bacteroidota bacterium]
MDYKLICTDIDGTLLNKNRELSPATIAVIKQLSSRIPFVLISSRMPAAMRHLQAETNTLEQPLICYNGGLILDGDQTINSIEIATDLMAPLIDFNQDKKVHLSLYQNDDWFVPEYDFWAKREENNTKVTPEVCSNESVLNKWKAEKRGAHKIMCMGDEAKVEMIYQFLQEHFSNQLHLYRSKPTYLEIAPKEISKLTAIQELITHKYPVKLNEVVAFGDNYNDMEMLANVGLGVAVANAKEEVKAISDEITASGKEDGVAKFLSSLFKNIG